ncbi:hypothetical protein F4X86_03600 [Candidatus Saccharibacteria bacterium]|nr:hypothetical protein [Candidatus Saccharibacteria bacterium]
MLKTIKKNWPVAVALVAGIGIALIAVGAVSADSTRPAPGDEVIGGTAVDFDYRSGGGEEEAYFETDEATCEGIDLDGECILTWNGQSEPVPLRTVAELDGYLTGYQIGLSNALNGIEAHEAFKHMHDMFRIFVAGRYEPVACHEIDIPRTAGSQSKNEIIAEAPEGMQALLWVVTDLYGNYWTEDSQPTEEEYVFFQTTYFAGMLVYAVTDEHADNVSTFCQYDIPDFEKIFEVWKTPDLYSDFGIDTP